MNTRKSMKLPIFITIFIIFVIIYLFTNIKQTTVVCHKTKTYESNIQLSESITASIENKRIENMDIVKTITVLDKNKKEQKLNKIKDALDNSLEYLGKSYSIKITENSVVARIQVNEKELVLLDNIDFSDTNGDLNIKIDVNTKSSDVISLTVGDNYTDGELMKRLKSNGFTCK